MPAENTEDPSAVSESETSPFTPVFEAVPEPESHTPSPFHVAHDGEDSSPQAFRPAKIPDKRKPHSPFQIVETGDGFGAMPATPAYPYPVGYGHTPSAFTPASPYAPYPVPPQAYQPYVLHPCNTHPYGPPPGYTQPVYPPPAAYPAGYPVYPQAETASPTSPTQPGGPTQTPTRQLELRAIFGVNHDMGRDEILQRSLSLTGIRNIAAIHGPESCAMDALRSLVGKLGFASDQLRICADQTPLEFIREGNTLLAVQTDGGFAPGVHETLTIVARELARLG